MVTLGRPFAKSITKARDLSVSASKWGVKWCSWININGGVFASIPGL